MKRKILVVLLLVIVMLFTVSCNKQIFDTNYKFTNAYVKIGDEWIDLEIKKWKDYEGEQIQIILKDDTVILTNSFNCILYTGTLPTVG